LADSHQVGDEVEGFRRGGPPSAAAVAGSLGSTDAPLSPRRAAPQRPRRPGPGPHPAELAPPRVSVQPWDIPRLPRSPGNRFARPPTAFARPGRMQLDFQRTQLGDQCGIAVLPHARCRHHPILQRGTDKAGPKRRHPEVKVEQNNSLSVNQIGQRGRIRFGLFRHATVLTAAEQLFRMTVTVLTLERWPLPGR
jgi:hypothetical protein